MLVVMFSSPVSFIVSHSEKQSSDSLKNNSCLNWFLVSDIPQFLDLMKTNLICLMYEISFPRFLLVKPLDQSLYHQRIQWKQLDVWLGAKDMTDQ